MFAGDDEDGDFLSPAGGAKLASLFGLDQETSKGNESFQYTAPKQPRKNSNPTPASQKQQPPPSGAPAVLFATAVQAFRYINGQYVKQGKLGAAALGNHATKEYKLLLYLSQQKQVAAAKIHTGFVFTVQPNNYFTFYDDQRQNWSLMFESEKASSDFCREICLAKANSAASLDSVVLQDLSPGEGQGVEVGDSLEVAYTGWLLQNHAIGQMFDSNQNKDKLLRLKVGAGKVIKGWEEGMLGMKKSGRRLIVVPPHLAYGSKGLPDCIPAHSTLVFEVEIRRVKFSKDSGSDRASASSRDSAAPSPAPSPGPGLENLTPELPSGQPAVPGPGRPGEQPLRAKSDSLSEQLANPDATKAKLISRMAKMGQPMLPFLTGAASQPESSDSELEDTSGSRVKDGPAASSPVQISTAAPASAHAQPHPHATAPAHLHPALSTQLVPGGSHAFQPYYTQTTVAPTQLQPVYPAQTVPYMGPSDVTSFLMTEARQHNTEIRLSVGKVADKVEQLNSKIDDLQRQGSLSMGMSGMSMETSMIMHNIQRIVQENECLKKEVFDKSSRIEEQNRKIGELINQNQRYVEQSNTLLEQRNDSLKSSGEHNQARLLQAEQDKLRLTEDLSASTARLAQQQLEASCHQQKAAELQGKLNAALQDAESHGQRIVALQAQLEELKEAAERTQAQYRSERQARKETELRVSSLEEELLDLRADKEALERTLAERKRKWQDERQRRDEESEELRRSCQREVDDVRAQLRKARSSSDSAASEQLSQLQAELEEDWKRKCEQTLASAEEQHRRNRAELSEQRDALQEELAQLQDKFKLLKQSRDSEELGSGKDEELKVLQERYATLELEGAAAREALERRVAELEKKLDEQEASGDTSAEVKRVMNGVFHSLRAEFELEESYSGQAVLGVIISTIKNVTLQLLSGTQRSSNLPQKEEDDEEEEEEEDEEEEERQEVEQSPEDARQSAHVNGDGRVGEEEKEEEEKVDEEHGVQQDTGVTETLVKQEVSAEVETESVKETRQASDGPPSSSDQVSLQESEKRPDHGVPKSPLKDSNSSEARSEKPGGRRSPPDGGRDEAAVASTEVEPEISEKCEKRGGGIRAESEEAFGPPTHPPPPPDANQENTCLTGGMSERNGTEPFFPMASSPAKHRAAASEEEEEEEDEKVEEEEEEDELSLKGHPPPAPLFGEEDEDDLDWLS